MSRCLLVLACLLVAACQQGDAPGGDGPGPWADADVTAADGPTAAGNPLLLVKHWAYQIDRVEAAGAVDRLGQSRYDMLVLDPTRTAGQSTFDSKGMVTRLHKTKGKSGRRRLVLAYLSIGEAEQARYYWRSWWKAPTAKSKGDPDFLLTTDPDGWDSVYPVAYWDARWKKILVRDADSMLSKVLADGYDGVYMDWVEAFYHKQVAGAAKAVGKDPAAEMIALIRELGAAARKQRSGFILVAQNAPELATGHPEYLKLIHGIAQEPWLFDGEADAGWSSPKACDEPIPTGDRAYFQKLLAPFLAAGLRVLNVEYACAAANVKQAHDLAAKAGYLPYVTRRPLDRLTTTPPPGL